MLWIKIVNGCARASRVRDKNEFAYTYTQVHGTYTELNWTAEHIAGCVRFTGCDLIQNQALSHPYANAADDE